MDNIEKKGGFAMPFEDMTILESNAPYDNITEPEYYGFNTGITEGVGDWVRNNKDAIKKGAAAAAAAGAVYGAHKLYKKYKDKRVNGHGANIRSYMDAYNKSRNPYDYGGDRTIDIDRNY